MVIITCMNQSSQYHVYTCSKSESSMPMLYIDSQIMIFFYAIDRSGEFLFA